MSATSYENSTPTQADYIERWEQALRVLTKMTKHERERHFNMSHWGERTECGTVACLAGHCSLDPWFRERGFRSYFAENGALYFRHAVPEDFFGDVGETRVFMKLSATYDEVVELTKQHIQYLKDGGEPNEDYSIFLADPEREDE